MLTDKCLGTYWWAFTSTAELEGFRLPIWRSQAEVDEEAEEERADPEYHEIMESD
jgi:hypothetical protein